MVNFCGTQFATQFTHVSRQYRANNWKQKFKGRKNCLAIVVSDLWKNGWINPSKDLNFFKTIEPKSWKHESVFF